MCGLGGGLEFTFTLELELVMIPLPLSTLECPDFGTHSLVFTFAFSRVSFAFRCSVLESLDIRPRWSFQHNLKRLGLPMHGASLGGFLLVGQISQIAEVCRVSK